MASVFDASGGSIEYMVLKELPRSVVCYGGSSTPLPGTESLSSRGEPGVALDRGEAYAEEASGLGLGGAALLDGLDYLQA
jgi:hypothetical protein